MKTPTHLYRYRSFNAHSLAEITSKELWFSRPRNFNDPFDCALGSSLISTVERNLECIQLLALNAAIEAARAGERGRGFGAVADQVRSHVSNTQDWLVAAKKKIEDLGVCSFSSLPDQLLMWAHYADSHKGFCIEYEIGLKPSQAEIARPVEYRSKRPSLSAHALAANEGDADFDPLWLIKSKHWGYEKEWRVMKRAGGAAYPSPWPISSIIFGARMAERDRQTIRSILNHDGDVAFRSSSLSNKYFRLDISDRLGL